MTAADPYLDSVFAPSPPEVQVDPNRSSVDPAAPPAPVAAPVAPDAYLDSVFAPEPVTTPPQANIKPTTDTYLDSVFAPEAAPEPKAEDDGVEIIDEEPAPLPTKSVPTGRYYRLDPEKDSVFAPLKQIYEDVPDVPRMSDLQASLYLGVPIGSVAKYRDMVKNFGPIGPIENVRGMTPTQWGEKLPFVGDLFTISHNEDFARHAETLKAYHGSLKDHQEVLKDMQSGKDVSIPDDMTPQEYYKRHLDNYKKVLSDMQRTEAADFMNDHLERVAELTIRGQSFLAQVGSGLAVLPKYMVEFMATGGVYGKAKGIGVRLALWGGAGRMTARFVGAFLGSGVRTLALFPKVIGLAGTKRLPKVEKDINGAYIVTPTKKTAVWAYFEAFTTQFAEHFGEVGGPGVTRMMRKYAPNTAKFLAQFSGGALGKKLKVAGFHGMLLEWPEERATQFMQKLASEFGIDTGEKDWWPDLERAMVEFGVLLPLGAAGGVAGVVANKGQKAKFDALVAVASRARAIIEGERKPVVNTEHVNAQNQQELERLGIREPVVEPSPIEVLRQEIPDAQDVGPQSEDEQQALDFAADHGVNVTFVETSNEQFQGRREGNNAFVRSGQAVDLVWETVAHETAHATGMDTILEEHADFAEMADARRRTLEKSTPAYRAALEADEARLNREAVALLVGEVMRDPAARARLQKSNPNLFARIIGAIRRTIANLGIRSDFVNRVLAEFESVETEAKTTAAKPVAEKAPTEAKPAPAAEEGTAEAEASDEVKVAAARAMAAPEPAPVETKAPVAEPDQVSPEEVGPQPQQGELTKDQIESQKNIKKLTGQNRRRHDRAKVNPWSEYKKQLKALQKATKDAVADVVARGVEVAEFAVERLAGLGVIPKQLKKLLGNIARVQDQNTETELIAAIEGLARLLEGDVSGLSTKARVNRVTGVTKGGEYQSKELREFYQHDTKTALAAYKQAAIDMLASGKKLVEVIKARLGDISISVAQRNRLLASLNAATTSPTGRAAKVRSVLMAVEAIAQKAEKQAVITRLLKQVEKGPPDGIANNGRLSDLWRNLVNSFQRTDPNNTTIQSLLAFLKATNKELADNEYQQIPSDLIDVAKETLLQLEKLPLKRWDLADLQAAEDIISRLITQAQTATITRAKLRAREVEKKRKKFEADVKKLYPEADQSLNEEVGLVTRAIRKIKKLWWNMAATQDVFASMIAGDQSGFWKETVWRMVLAQEESVDLRRNLFEGPLRKALKALGIGEDYLQTFSPDLTDPGSGRDLKTARKFMRKINITPLGNRKTKKARSFDATPGEMIQLLLMFKDQEVRAELLRNQQRGFAFKVDRFGGGTIKLSAEDMTMIQDQATPSEKGIVKALSGIYNGEVADLMNQLWRRTRDTDFTSNRNMVPTYRRKAKKDPTSSEKGEARRKRQYTNLDQQTTFRRRTGGDEAYVVEDAFNVFAEHAVQLSEVLAKDEAYSDVHAILTDTRNTADGDSVDGTATMIRRHVPNAKAILKIMEDNVNHFGAMENMPSPPAGDISNLVSWFTRKFSFGKLAIKPQIMLYQKLSLINASEFIAWKHLHNANLLNIASAAEDAELRAWVGSIADRFEGGAAQIMSPGMGGGISARSIAIGNKASLVEALGTGGIHRVDKGTIIHLWRAAKLQTDGDLAKARELLILVVNRTQPHWDLLNNPAIVRAARGNPFVKMLMLFSSQKTTNNTSTLRAWVSHTQSTMAANRQRATDKAAGMSLVQRNLKYETAVAKTRARLAKEVMRHLVVTGSGVIAIRTGLNVLLSGGDDDAWKDFRYWIENVVDSVFGNFMLGTGVVPAYATKRLLNKYVTGDSKLKYDYDGDDPIGRTFDDMKRLVEDIIKYYDGDKVNLNQRNRFEKMLIKMARLLSNFGLPTDGPAQIWNKMTMIPKLTGRSHRPEGGSDGGHVDRGERGDK